MAEPAATSLAAGAVAGVTLLSLFPGVDASTLLGAFAGAAVFVMSDRDLTVGRRLLFLLLSIAAGITLGPFATSAIDTLIPERIVVHEAVGATLAAAVGVKLLLWLIGKAGRPDEALRDILGRGGRP